MAFAVFIKIISLHSITQVIIKTDWPYSNLILALTDWQCSLLRCEDFFSLYIIMWGRLKEFLDLKLEEWG